MNRYTLSVCIASAALISLIACTTPRAAVELSNAQTFLAADMVDIRDLVPDIALDIRYAGTHNFVGTPIDGYDAPKCYLKAAAAKALQRVEVELRSSGLRLKLFDCYRPARAVSHFVRWVNDSSDQRTQAEYYPRLDKSGLLGVYIAGISGHSRGATLDLTLMRCEDSARCEELDMGTPFDFFDERAHTDHPAVTAAQRESRHRLRAAMTREGFENYSAEWWHYSFTPEPTPTQMYDVPIR